MMRPRKWVIWEKENCFFDFWVAQLLTALDNLVTKGGKLFLYLALNADSGRRRLCKLKTATILISECFICEELNLKCVPYAPRTSPTGSAFLAVHEKAESD